MEGEAWGRCRCGSHASLFCGLADSAKNLSHLSGREELLRLNFGCILHSSRNLDLFLNVLVVLGADRLHMLGQLLPDDEGLDVLEEEVAHGRVRLSSLQFYQRK